MAAIASLQVVVGTGRTKPRLERLIGLTYTISMIFVCHATDTAQMMESLHHQGMNVIAIKSTP